MHLHRVLHAHAHMCTTQALSRFAMLPWTLSHAVSCQLQCFIILPTSKVLSDIAANNEANKMMTLSDKHPAIWVVAAGSTALLEIASQATLPQVQQTTRRGTEASGSDTQTQRQQPATPTPPPEERQASDAQASPPLAPAAEHAQADAAPGAQFEQNLHSIDRSARTEGQSMGVHERSTGGAEQSAHNASPAHFGASDLSPISRPANATSGAGSTPQASGDALPSQQDLALLSQQHDGMLSQQQVGMLSQPFVAGLPLPSEGSQQVICHPFVRLSMKLQA